MGNSLNDRETPSQDSEVEEAKFFAAVGYLNVLCFVPLFSFFSFLLPSLLLSARCLISCVLFLAFYFIFSASNSFISFSSSSILFSNSGNLLATAWLRKAVV